MGQGRVAWRTGLRRRWTAVRGPRAARPRRSRRRRRGRPFGCGAERPGCGSKVPTRDARGASPVELDSTPSLVHSRFIMTIPEANHFELASCAVQPVRGARVDRRRLNSGFRPIQNVLVAHQPSIMRQFTLSMRLAKIDNMMRSISSPALAFLMAASTAYGAPDRIDIVTIYTQFIAAGTAAKYCNTMDSVDKTNWLVNNQIVALRAAMAIKERNPNLSDADLTAKSNEAIEGLRANVNAEASANGCTSTRIEQLLKLYQIQAGLHFN